MRASALIRVRCWLLESQSCKKPKDACQLATYGRELESTAVVLGCTEVQAEEGQA